MHKPGFEYANLNTKKSHLVVFVCCHCTDTATGTHIPDNLFSTTAPDVAMLPLDSN